MLNVWTCGDRSKSGPNALVRSGNPCARTEIGIDDARMRTVERNSLFQFTIISKTLLHPTDDLVGLKNGDSYTVQETLQKNKDNHKDTKATILAQRKDGG